MVVYGLQESSAGTKKYQRVRYDLECAGSVLSLIEPTITESSIRECRRLGKFKEGLSRPLLLYLYRSVDVNAVLSGRRKLSTKPHITIKPDLSPEERKVEQLLLKERRTLIQSGAERNTIKIRGSSLYVKNQKYGEVRDDKFVIFSSVVPNEAVINVSSPESKEHGTVPVQQFDVSPSESSAPQTAILRSDNNQTQSLLVKGPNASQ